MNYDVTTAYTIQFTHLPTNTHNNENIDQLNEHTRTPKFVAYVDICFH